MSARTVNGLASSSWLQSFCVFGVDGRPVSKPQSQPDYWYLCCNCGGVAPADYFEALRWDDEGELVPAPDGWEDPILRCPVCRWEHTDDDSNPGLYDGTFDEMQKQRAELAADLSYAELWS